MNIINRTEQIDNDAHVQLSSFTVNLFQHTHTHYTTFPVVCARSPKDEVVVVPVECGRQALLAGAKHLMAPGPALTEMPATSVFARIGIDGQVLTQHIAAANDLTGFDGCVHIGPLLVAMGTGLPGKQKHGLIMLLRL